MRLLPDARLEVFPNAGHMLPMERSDEVAALILQFADELDEVDRTWQQGPASATGC